MIASCENAYAQAFIKIFKTFNLDIIKQCQFYSGELPLKLKIVKKKINFLSKLKESRNEICKFFSNMQNELETICHLYNIQLPLNGRINCDAVLWTGA